MLPRSFPWSVGLPRLGPILIHRQQRHDVAGRESPRQAPGHRVRASAEAEGVGIFSAQAEVDAERADPSRPAPSGGRDEVALDSRSEVALVEVVRAGRRPAEQHVVERLLARRRRSTSSAKASATMSTLPIDIMLFATHHLGRADAGGSVQVSGLQRDKDGGLARLASAARRQRSAPASPARASAGLPLHRADQPHRGRARHGWRRPRAWSQDRSCSARCTGFRIRPRLDPARHWPSRAARTALGWGRLVRTSLAAGERRLDAESAICHAVAWPARGALMRGLMS